MQAEASGISDYDLDDENRVIQMCQSSREGGSPDGSVKRSCGQELGVVGIGCAWSKGCPLHGVDFLRVLLQVKDAGVLRKRPHLGCGVVRARDQQLACRDTGNVPGLKFAFKVSRLRLKSGLQVSSIAVPPCQKTQPPSGQKLLEHDTTCDSAFTCGRAVGFTVENQVRSTGWQAGTLRIPLDAVDLICVAHKAFDGALLPHLGNMNGLVGGACGEDVAALPIHIQNGSCTHLQVGTSQGPEMCYTC